MSARQRSTLLIGALLFVALGTYVPWHNAGSTVQDVKVGEDRYEERAPVAAAAAAGEFDRSLGYALIFRPPNEASRIDLSRLAVEWLSLTVLVGTFICLLANRERK